MNPRVGIIVWSSMVGIIVWSSMIEMASGRVQPPQFQCTATTESVGSVLCLSDCNTPNPDDGTLCFSSSKTCAFCSTVTSTVVRKRVASGYAVTLRPSCSSTHRCQGSNVLAVTSGFLFEGYSDLTIEGGGGASVNTSSTIGDPLVATVRGPCPLIVLDAIETVTLQNLVLECEQDTQSSSSLSHAAIVIKNTPKLKLVAQGVYFSGYVKTGILLLGGDRKAVPRIETTQVVAGSTLVNVVVSESVYRSHCAAAMANFLGGLSVSECDHQMFVVQPSSGTPKAFIEPINTTVRIVNVSRYTSVFGQEYEQDFYVENQPMPSEARAVFTALLNSFVVLFVLAVVLHGPRLYWYTRYKAIQG